MSEAREKPSYPLQQALELACAAQRVNQEYVKELTPIYSSDGRLMYYKQPNRYLIKIALGEEIWSTERGDPLAKPTLLCTNLADQELATDIKKYFRKLIFTAIAGEDSFLTDLNSVLSLDTVPANKMGFVACLPGVYQRDYANTRLEKLVTTLSPGHLGEIDEWLFDLDCEVLSSKRSKNFDAYNIDAIIDNKMVSWMGKADLKLGACVVLKAKVKAYSDHWKYKNPVTRLNYVKAFQ